MRPLRFILLVACFIFIPVFLTCVSLIQGQSNTADVFQRPQRSRLRALFSFSTPSALFPPSAIISLTFENSTFFLARPAAFGPSLPSKGLSGQLWIGRGFGDDKSVPDDELKSSGFELGCSDVPGWGDGRRRTPDDPTSHDRSIATDSDGSPSRSPSGSQLSSDMNVAEGLDTDGTLSVSGQDGTDDHLHRPLLDSNPAPVVKPGESAEAAPQDKTKKPTHADIESLQESAAIAGKIVMLSRGGCGFLEKVKWAQRRGGIAVIVGDNERNGQLTIMYAKGDTSNITIPAIFTSYTSAHLLSSLVPPELNLNSNTLAGKGQKSDTVPVDKTKAQAKPGPVFTSTTISKHQPTSKTDSHRVGEQHDQGWMQNVLQVVGLDPESLHTEDSRRPPGSGNIEWVQVKDWNDDMAKSTSTGTQSMTSSKTMVTSVKQAKHQTTSKVGDNDFVIGVQDWRDTEMIAPRSTSTVIDDSRGKKAKDEIVNTSTALAGKETELKGGSIIPGSGEYQKPDKTDEHRGHDDIKRSERPRDDHQGILNTFKSWFRKSPKSSDGRTFSSQKGLKQSSPVGKPRDGEEHQGLWITLTPTSVSASPFFDTLLVLVVSPLVTLTFVYGLLLLRSRIRRRRWRAPKSVVERLPVRTYHTMSSASSTSSAQPTPHRSPAASPQLRPELVRSRQRSQTTIGVLTSGAISASSPPREKVHKNQQKRYRGRQIECVVCLEEYIDGESKVMSLPCGHEFHAECITPWLVNRRRTCPICKGDVVRSLQREGSNIEEDNTEAGEVTADDIQDRAATTVPDDPIIAAIPIPDRRDGSSIMDDDIERGEQSNTTGDDNVTNRPIASRWRGLLSASVPNLGRGSSWPSNSNDRDR